MPEKVTQIPGISAIEDDERMLEDDIDRLIAEIQNKPYDSSRYLENSNIPQSNYK